MYDLCDNNDGNVIRNEQSHSILLYILIVFSAFNDESVHSYKMYVALDSCV